MSYCDDKPDWLKEREWKQFKSDVQESVWTFRCKRRRGVEDFGFKDAPRLDSKTKTIKKARVGAFTTDDLEEANQSNADYIKRVEANMLRAQKEREYEKERWEELKKKWEKNKKDLPLPLIEPTEPECDKPGIFVVSQKYNNEYDTFDSFVCVAKCVGDARMMHPSDDDSDYKKSELTRNEEWLQRNPDATGPAPGWFLGLHNSWVHCAYVEVERISYYTPPNGKEPKFGIVSTSFRAG